MREHELGSSLWSGFQAGESFALRQCSALQRPDRPELRCLSVPAFVNQFLQCVSGVV